MQCPGRKRKTQSSKRKIRVEEKQKTNQPAEKDYSIAHSVRVDLPALTLRLERIAAGQERQGLFFAANGLMS